MFVVTLNNFAQQITFEKWYNYGFTENGYSVAQTFDGGYIVAGRHGISFSVSDLLLIKTDSLGNEEWVKFISTGAWEHEGKDIKQTADSGFIITGMTEAMGMGANILIVKTDKNGDTLWTKSYGSTGYDIGNSIEKTFDIGFLIVGVVHDTIAIIIKIDSIGDTIWTKKFLPIGAIASQLKSVRQLNDSGFIITGVVVLPSSIYGNYTIRINNIGDTLWTKIYLDQSYPQFVDTLTSGGFILTGFKGISGAGNCLYLIRMNNNGDTVWTKSFGGSISNDDCGQACHQDKNGNLIIAGYTTSFGFGQYDFYLLKVDTNGVLIWQHTYGGPGLDFLYNMQITKDCGFIMVGITDSYNPPQGGVYLVKTDSGGNILASTPHNFSFKNELIVYPNPANQQLNLAYKFDNPSSQNFLIIYNILGQEILKQVINNEIGVLNLNTDKLENAIYQAVIISNGKIIKTEKISIQK